MYILYNASILIISQLIWIIHETHQYYVPILTFVF